MMKIDDKQMIKDIIEITATIDKRDFHVWGKDTDLGIYHEIASDVREKLKPLILSPIFIEKDIADMIRKANKRALMLEIRLKQEKNNTLEKLFQLELKKEKEMIDLKRDFGIMSKEYTKLIKEWRELKYG